MENRQKKYPPFSKIVFPTIHGLAFICKKRISHFKSQDNYCVLVDIDNQEHFVARSLKVVEQKLTGQAFCRVHRSFLVNLQRMSKYKSNGANLLVMDCGSEIPVSKRKKSELMNVISQFSR